MIPFSLNELYRSISISKQAIYKQSEKVKQNRLKTYELRCQIDLIRQDHPGCGLEKIYYQLQPDWIGRDRFIKLFSSLGYCLNEHKKQIRTTLPVPIKYENLIEGLLIFGIDTVWQTDITYYRVREEMCYIVFIEDIYSRRILGHQASDHMRAEANMQTLEMSHSTRDFRDLTGTIHHSDKGSQYTDKEYLKMLDNKNILISMGSRGQDNAYVERLNGIIKNEYLKHWSINSLKDLRLALGKAVTHYNNHRIHRSLPGKLSPIEFEKMITKDPGNILLNEWVYSNKLKLNQNKYNFEISDLTAKTLVCPMVE